MVGNCGGGKGKTLGHAWLVTLPKSWPIKFDIRSNVVGLILEPPNSKPALMFPLTTAYGIPHPKELWRKTKYIS